MSDQSAPLPSIPRGGRKGPSRPSFSQQRLWFADQIGQRGLEFVYPYALRLRGPLDVTAFAAALDAVVARHEALRTTFTSRDGEPLQVVNAPFSLGLTAGPLADGASLEQVLRAEVELPFDLENGPVLRARLIRLGPEEHVFLLVIHHIAVDG